MFSPTGLFVCFEGGEGCGKSTQSRLLVEGLTAAGHDVVATRQPGGSPNGQQIRRILLDPATGHLDPRAEALLYAADKAEHLDKVVLPALQRGAIVVTDRYVDSSLAYQGAGRSIPTDELARVLTWATGGLRPHLTVLLDLDPSVAMTRFDGRDRIEGEPLEFHQRVRDGFRALAEADPEHYLVLDASAPVDEIAAEVRAHVESLL